MKFHLIVTPPNRSLGMPLPTEDLPEDSDVKDKTSRRYIIK